MAIGTLLDVIAPDHGLLNEGIHARSLPDSCITLSANSITDTASIGDPLGTLSIGCAYQGTPIWSLVNDGHGAFTVNPSTGVVSVASGLDAAATPTIDIKVKVRGTKPQIISPTFTISVGEGGGGGDYVAKAVHFDGTQFSNINSFEAPNSSSVFWSFWVKNDPSSNGGIFVTDPAGAYTSVSYIAATQVANHLGDVGDNNFLVFNSSGWTNSAWHHVLVAAKTDYAANSKKYKIYIDDVDVTLLVADNKPSFSMTFNGKMFYIFTDFDDDPMSPAGTVLGDVADFMLASGIDLFGGGSDIPEATRRLFIDANGKPVNPAVAVAALGTPAVLFSGDASGFPTNQGNGGAFTLWNGPFTNATTSPSD
jgi:hypothetical protein